MYQVSPLFHTARERVYHRTRIQHVFVLVCGTVEAYSGVCGLLTPGT